MNSKEDNLPIVEVIDVTSKSLIHTNTVPPSKEWYIGKKTRITAAHMKKLSLDLLGWAYETNDAYCINQFFHQRGIWKSQVQQWRKKWPKFSRAYDEAMLMIGDRREIDALFKKIDGKLMMQTQHLYDPEWDEINRYHSALRRPPEKAANTSIICIMSPDPTPSMVPALNKRQIT